MSFLDALQDSSSRVDHTLPGTTHMTCRGRAKIPGNIPLQTVLLHAIRVQFLQRFSQRFGSANEISPVIAKDLLRGPSTGNKSAQRINEGVCIQRMSNFYMNCSHG